MANIKNMDWKDWMIISLFVLLVGVALFAGIYYNKYHDASGQIVIWNDSLTTYKNKYNEEYLAKNTYILKAEQLKEYNEELYKEYQSLKDNPVVITKTETITKIDSIFTSIDSIWNNGNKLVWSWSANDSIWYNIKGIASADYKDNDSSFVNINNLTINSNITMDVIDDGKQLKVIAKSNNPYMSLTDMQSIVIDPLNSPTIKALNKSKRWGFGPYIGLGIYGGWDLTNKNVCLGLGGSIGFSIHYSLIQW